MEVVITVFVIIAVALSALAALGGERRDPLPWAVLILALIALVTRL